MEEGRIVQKGHPQRAHPAGWVVQRTILRQQLTNQLEGGMRHDNRKKTPCLRTPI